MTLDEFTLLDETRQAEELIDRGIFLAERMYKNFSIFLYQLDDFYVEIYHNMKYNVMQGMRSFSEANELEPFLESIDISAIYQY